MKDTILQILGQLYEYDYNTDEYDYETVNRYFAFLRVDLGLNDELENIGIMTTSDLQEQMLNRENKI